MRKLLLAPLLVVSMLFPTAVAQASPPQPASGTFTIVSSVPGVPRFVDTQIFFQETNTILFTGTLAGTAVCDTTVRLDLSTGTGTFNCEGPFTGTVAGVPDILVLQFVGTIHNFGATAAGQWVILGQQDDTNPAAAHGQGTFVQVGPAGTYSGQVHFDPS
jgi:hypothetical protein